MKKRFRYRAYPDTPTRQRLGETFGACRFVYNRFVAERQALFEAGRHTEVKFDDTFKAVTSRLKAEPGFEWLREVSAVALQQSVRDAEQAYRNFFASVAGTRKGKRMAPPRFKKRGGRQAARFTNAARFKVHASDGSGWGVVDIPKVGQIKYRNSRPLPSAPSSVTVIENPDGTFEVSFVVDVPDAAPVPREVERAAGIDVGFTDLAAIVYSDGTREKIENPRWLRRKQRHLARTQRALARKQKGSRNREKARVRVAKAHAKVARTRLDHHTKLARRLVAENTMVAHETLDLAGMGRTRLAKSVHDAGLSTLFQLIATHAESQGVFAVKSGRWEPTTQTCSVCGTPGGKKPLHVREWTCGGCGTLLDRDYNAAVNVLVAAGLAETLNACGGNIRLPLAAAVPDEAGTTPVTPVDAAAAA